MKVLKNVYIEVQSILEFDGGQTEKEKQQMPLIWYEVIALPFNCNPLYENEART